MVQIINTAELQLNTAIASDTEAAFLDLNLSIDNETVSTKIYNKRDLDVVNFRFSMVISLGIPPTVCYTFVALE